MDTSLIKHNCKLLFVLLLLLASRKATGNQQAAASLAAMDGVDDALELQLQQDLEQEEEQEEEQEQMPAEVELDMVPASARGSFLLYQLAKAINSGQLLEYELAQEHEQELIVEQEVHQVLDSSWLAAMANEFQNVPVYEGFNMNFENWLIDSYGLNAIDVYQGWSLMRSGRGREICNAVGHCFEVAQILSACCPF